MPLTMSTMTTTTDSRPMPSTGVGRPVSAEAARGTVDATAAAPMRRAALCIALSAAAEGTAEGVLGRKAGPKTAAKAARQSRGARREALRAMARGGLSGVVAAGARG
eukprot:CAMPEP_0179055844 /NCGR_PEP_ID=MMETSP0796-20121207/23509_1 /TAXON_ID=73915 /ORGANISM="Pyrodinium bahamense, Strain pbaha01" /LENGTH=106 /DNA_ID=CAMNT_0020752507 /DNA_START=138 /DNA_END=458 /DNA_ORIENTATION=+